jgi:hypothetical protein
LIITRSPIPTPMAPHTKKRRGMGPAVEKQIL